jgi:phosphate transport system substrate-binding protein
VSAGDTPSAAAPAPVPEPVPTTTPLPPVKRKRSYTGIVVAVVVIVVIAGILAVGYEQKWFGGKTSPSNEAACPTGITLQGNGAQIVEPLMSVWTANYASTSGDQVNYVDGGSGTGETDFSQNPPLIDFAVSDAPLNATQRAALPSSALTLPIVAGAITVIYNLPGVTAHLNLTGAVLAEIYNGNITMWNNTAIQSINPGVTLPADTITTVHRVDAAGTSYVLTNLLSDDSPYWAHTIGTGLLPSWPHTASETAVKGNSLMLSTVASTKYAIGYSDLTDTLTYSTPLQYAAIENPAGHFITPTLADTASAISDKVSTLTSQPTSEGSWYGVSMVNANGSGDYPVSTFIYLYVYQNASKGFSPSLDKTQVLLQWIDYMLSPAAQALTDATTPTQLYYVALPATILSIDTTGLSTMTFNGSSLPACK